MAGRLELTACTVDLIHRVVQRGSDSVRLSAREADLLGYLVDRPRVTVSREELLVQVWGYAPHVQSRAVDATASRVRTKIEANRDQPRHLLTVHGEGYCFVPAHAAVPERPRSNVTPRRGRFIGREAVLAEIMDLIDEHRCVSVLGPPGVGKTTLARVLARRLSEDPHWAGVWFCEIAGARDLEGVVGAVASVLELGPAATVEAAVEQIGHALAGAGRCLLVLDNFEQVMGTTRDTIVRWLDAVDDARVLVTSRERLNIGGERCVPLPALGPVDARRLLLALAADAGAPPPAPADEPQLDEIVDRLDGLPLAIELAASRLRVLGPSGLLARLDQRFEVLASRRRDHDERQRTLEAALDWSWDLLSEVERACFAQGAVFRGPFSLQAAEAVVEVPGPVLDVVQSLVDKSLWVIRADGRIGQLQSIAAYARLRLEGMVTEGAIERAALEHRHAIWFAGSRPPTDPETIADRLAAADAALGQGSVALATEAVVGADRILQRQGPRGPVVERASKVLAAGPSSSDEARMHFVLADAHQLAGRLSEARAAYERGLVVVPENRPDLRGQGRRGLGQVAQRQGDLDAAVADLERSVHDLSGSAAGWAWARLGVARMRRGELSAARADQQTARELARDHGDEALDAFALANLVAVCLRQGRLDEGAALGLDAIDAARRASDQRMEAIASGNLGALQATRGDLDAAAMHYERSLALHHGAGNRPGACSTLCNLGDLELHRGRLDVAEGYLLDALELARALGAQRQEGLARLNLGLVYLEVGRPEAGASLEAAHAVFTSIGVPRLAAIALSHAGAARTAAGEDAVDALVQATDTLVSLGDALQAALSRARLVRALRQAGRPEEASASLSEVATTAAELGVRPDSELAAALMELRAD